MQEECFMGTLEHFDVKNLSAGPEITTGQIEFVATGLKLKKENFSGFYRKVTSDQIIEGFQVKGEQHGYFRSIRKYGVVFSGVSIDGLCVTRWMSDYGTERSEIKRMQDSYEGTIWWPNLKMNDDTGKFHMEEGDFQAIVKKEKKKYQDD